MCFVSGVCSVCCGVYHSCHFHTMLHFQLRVSPVFRSCLSRSKLFAMLNRWPRVYHLQTRCARLCFCSLLLRFCSRVFVPCVCVGFFISTSRACTRKSSCTHTHLSLCVCLCCVCVSMCVQHAMRRVSRVLGPAHRRAQRVTTTTSSLAAAVCPRLHLHHHPHPHHHHRPHQLRVQVRAPLAQLAAALAVLCLHLVSFVLVFDVLRAFCVSVSDWMCACAARVW